MGLEHEMDEFLAESCSTRDIAASRSRSRWSVEAGDWPDLPPEVIELLAAPVVVTTLRVPEPEPEAGDGPDYPPPTEPCAVRHGYGECMPSFLPPVVPARPAASAGFVSADSTLPRSRRTRRRI